MSVGTAYKDIWDWLYNHIKNLKDEDGNSVFSNVFKTTKEKIQKFPACAVVPTNDDIEMMTGTRDWHNLHFECACGVSSQKMEEGMGKALEKAGRIYKLVRDNPKLGGNCKDVHVTDFDPDWEPMGGKYAQHWVLVTIRARKDLPVCTP